MNMNMQTWYACDYPRELLRFVAPAFDDRKFRLYLCARAREVSHLVFDDNILRAIPCTELYADGMITQSQWSESLQTGYFTARKLNDEFIANYESAPLYYTRAYADQILTDPKVAEYALQLKGVCATWEATHLDCRVEGILESRSQFITDQVDCAILRDIFNPFYKVNSTDPEWRTITVFGLAKQMYESRDFSAMPILVDALQDAGCDCEAILSHCRESGHHVKGCFVVDAILGKE